MQRAFKENGYYIVPTILKRNFPLVGERHLNFQPTIDKRTFVGWMSTHFKLRRT